MPIYYIAGFPVSDELYHHGIKGQRWGVRRYQNEDGTLTAAGKARYGSAENFKNAQDYKAAKKQYNKTKSDSDYRKLSKAYDKYEKSKMDESVKRGDKLLKTGTNTKKVLAKGAVRQLGIEVIKGTTMAMIGTAIVTGMLSYQVNLNDPETVATIQRGTRAISAVIGGAATAATVANISKTAIDYRDIRNAQQRRQK